VTQRIARIGVLQRKLVVELPYGSQEDKREDGSERRMSEESSASRSCMGKVETDNYQCDEISRPHAWTISEKNYTGAKKPSPTLYSCNLNKHYPSLIIFCTYVTKGLGNQKLVYIPTSPE